jgi:alpha-L-rhamnosidase
MMGAIDDWSYRYLAGIRSTEPGFREFVVAPLIPSDLEHMEASLESPYGTIESAWSKRDGGLRQRVSVPVNSRAEVRVPTGGLRTRVRVNGRLAWDGSRGHAYGAHADGDRIVLPRIGSGSWSIESRPIEPAR